MSVINLTPHSVQVYSQESFVKLEKTNPTTWLADSVNGEPLANYNSEGVARITTNVEGEGDTTLGNHGYGCPVIPDSVVPLVATTYGKATGIPEGVKADDVLIVSLPMKSMAVASGHPLAFQMVSPFGVVRSRANSSLVLGCMGFTY